MTLAQPRPLVLFALASLTVALVGCGSPSARDLSRDEWIYPTDLPVETFAYMESEVTDIEPGLRARPFPATERLAGRPRSSAGRALEAGDIVAELSAGQQVEVPWRVPFDYEYLSRDHQVLRHADSLVTDIDRKLMTEKRLSIWSP